MDPSRHAKRLARVASHIVADPDADNGVARAPTSSPSAATGAGYDPHFPQCTTAASFPPPAHDALNLDSLLSSEEQALRRKVRSFMEEKVAPVITRYWERAEFPFEIVPELARLNVCGATIDGYGCPGHTLMENGLAVMELARVDASLATFVLVHNHLALLTIGLLGSEEQKREWLPGMSALTKVGCWALTEPSNGSDASALQTRAVRTQGGWRLTGQKRWIGNGTWADVAVVWARSSEDGQVNAFLVRKGAPGFKTEKMENKIALRCVQNADMTFVDCFVPDSDRLPGVTSFADTNKVLALSRVMVAWLPVGMSMGVYDVCVRYVQQRQQFGTPLAAFQATQEKLSRMLGSIQAMFLMAWQLTKQHSSGTLTHEQASLVKAWNTLRAREVAALGREMLGGNGVLAEFHVAKVFCDLEAIYTYEGTYEVNALVVGRGATGLSAIKAARRG